MFSYDELEDRLRVGAIADFASFLARNRYLDPDDQVIREMYVGSVAVTEISDLPQVPRASLQAEMTAFVTGEPVYWGDFREGNFLKPLNPAGRWVEFKVRAQPQVRLYGAFVRQDTFIGVLACLRMNQPDEDVLLTRWCELWGSDVSRSDIGDPALLLTEYRTVK